MNPGGAAAKTNPPEDVMRPDHRLTRPYLPAGVLALQAALLLVFVFFRYLDADEGIFLHAARMVRNGLTPYHEFFYMQMPYLPYLLAPLAGNGGWQPFYAARLLSAALSMGTALILYLAARRETGPSLVPVAALFLFAANGFTMAWHSVVKTAVFADFFGLAGAALFVQSMRRKGPRSLLLLASGVMFGLALNIRLTHVVLLGASILMALLFRRKELTEGLRDAALVTIGAALVSAGSLYLLALDPHTFYFHNAGFRYAWGYVTSPMGPGERALTLLRFAVYPQVLPILVLTGVSIRIAAARRKGPPLETAPAPIAWLVYAGALAVLYLAVSPTALQYFGQTVPYLVLASIPALARFEHLMRRRWLPAAAAALYLAAMLPFIWVFVFTARAKDAPYELDRLRETVAVIREQSGPEEPVLSFSPHLPFLAGRPAVPGTEVRGIYVMDHLSPEDRRVARLLTREDALTLVVERFPPLVVQEPDYIPELNAPLERHYRRVAELHGYVIFRRHTPARGGGPQAVERGVAEGL